MSRRSRQPDLMVITLQVVPGCFATSKPLWHAVDSSAIGRRWAPSLFINRSFNPDTSSYPAIFGHLQGPKITLLYFHRLGQPHLVELWRISQLRPCLLLRKRGFLPVGRLGGGWICQFIGSLPWLFRVDRGLYYPVMWEFQLNHCKDPY